MSQVGCASALHASVLRDMPSLSWRCVSQDKKTVTRARAEFFSQVRQRRPACAAASAARAIPRLTVAQRFKPAQSYACMESMFDLPFQKKSFDGIFYFGLKPSMDQQHARLLLCDAARVVKPDGVVVLIVAPPSADAASVIGPAWTRAGIEKPAGERDMGGWSSAFYTSEQQQRLHVDEHGAPRSSATALPLPASQSGSFFNSVWLRTAASTCGFEVLPSLEGTSLKGTYMIACAFALVAFSICR